MKMWPIGGQLELLRGVSAANNLLALVPHSSSRLFYLDHGPRRSIPPSATSSKTSSGVGRCDFGGAPSGAQNHVAKKKPHSTRGPGTKGNSRCSYRSHLSQLGAALLCPTKGRSVACCNSMRDQSSAEQTRHWVHGFALPLRIPRSRSRRR